MWYFSVGLYLVFFDGQLRLAAVFGFIASGCILLFGGLLGNWIDRNQRLKVIRISLFIQNFSVGLSAVGIAVLVAVPDGIVGSRYTAFIVLIIFLAVIARLASNVYKIALEKDWIVVVASGDSDHLARLNAVTRSVDLLCQAMSPLLVGQVMTYGSRLAGALFISGWNIFSVLLEYVLLLRVYNLVPDLAHKQGLDDLDVKPLESKTTNNAENGHVETETLMTDISKDDTGQKTEYQETTEKQSLQQQNTANETTQNKHSEKWHCVRLVFTPCIRLVTGWSAYMKQRVLLAGLSLAALYMTVLGFDSITIGYIYSQGVTESILGICSGLAAITGIIGTFIFTRLHKWIGLHGTGIIAFSVEVSFLLLTVISIWTPGSPFYLYDPGAVNCTLTSSTPTFENTTLISPPESIESKIEPRTKRHLSMFDASQNDVSLFLPEELANGLPSYIKDVPYVGSYSDRRIRDVSNVSISEVPYSIISNETAAPESNMCDPANKPKVSVILFLIGIITSRIGLWMADLTVTQLYQENVHEYERGTVGGVQNSLNMLLDMLKFVAVILLPDIHTFGILILMSFSFIILGLLFFTAHVFRMKYCSHKEGKKTGKDRASPQKNKIYRPSQEEEI